jgi:hydrogenase-4 component J
MMMSGTSAAVSPRAPSTGRYTPDTTIVFYRLTSKVVGMEEDISEKSRAIAYYTLAVGHHTGILDCFSVALHCTYAQLELLLDELPVGSYARFKLDGLRKFGEINIEQEHAAQLYPALKEAVDNLSISQQEWLCALLEELELVIRDPVIYLVGKRLL